jgi:hypothetical protein
MRTPSTNRTARHGATADARPMRLLLLGAPGPYPERLHIFRDAGYHLWWISTLLLPPTGPVPGVHACHLWDLARAPEETVERLVELIDTERIDAVYSLLNVWDGSQHPTALLLRRGCPVPVIRHYKEHYLSPSADERTCLEQSDGVMFILPHRVNYDAACHAMGVRVTRGHPKFQGFAAVGKIGIVWGWED